ncbi:MAG: tRNA guanosine(34) transglycosylase Tgt [Vampirovibrionales bacterium]|nr:tRNA guanosine(34) transglycosylase Tgt [Vampirovibrionales bacterium]
MSAPFSFEVFATEGEARAGVFKTPHGVVETPAFMPVGTQSVVKTLTQTQLAAINPQMTLANAYHLYLRPGHQLIQKAGGLHGWMNWPHPILTDSGGFQVFSLANHRKITEEGVMFRDPASGSSHFIGPEESMAIQNALGADVIMAFDECPPHPVTHQEAKTSLERTQRWLQRCFQAHSRSDQALFPIVQGAGFEDLRSMAAAHVQQFSAYGYAIGGVSVGEPPEAITRIVAHTAKLLPADKPRYLMGVGTPRDLLMGITHGIDLFDCVMPTRVARHGAFFTNQGRINIKRQEFESDFSPLQEGCVCEACRLYSRAYIRHLIRVDESTGKTLLSIHNITYLVQFAQKARRALLEGTFETFQSQNKAV